MTGALMMPLGMLGGLWIPLEFLPGWMTTLAHFVPTLLAAPRRPRTR